MNMKLLVQFAWVNTVYFISLYFTEDKSINPEETNTLKSFLELRVITFLEQCFLSYSFSLGCITQGEDISQQPDKVKQFQMAYSSNEGGYF